MTAPDSDRLIFLTTHHLVASAPTPAPPQQKVAVAARTTTAQAKPPAPSSSTVAAGTGQLGLINQDRAAAGLPPLQWNPCLAAVATQNAQRMAAQGYISHAGGSVQDLSCHLGSRTGENIGFVGGGPNDAMMNSWFMGDAPHRANILGPYHYVGSAWVITGNGTAYLAVEFG
ncbi:MAG TPA: CAP domain-containing protein [Candidatus Dormibacteraeota bacterium]|nr:CAP domain-containing protein [Candidatus Dormibacteraeota bacterium]